MKGTPLPVHVRLRRAKDVILSEWLTFAKSHENAVTHEINSPALINSLPHLLDDLAGALDPASEVSDAARGTSVSSEHGIQRAHVGRYSLDQIMLEYGWLQEVVIGALKRSGPLSIDESTVISRTFLSAARMAASAFVAASDEIHQESELQFKRLVEDAKDVAIFIISPEGIIQTWNKGAERIKQFSAEDVIGRHFRMLYQEEDRRAGRPEHNLKLVLEQGRFEEQWWRVKKDGTLWWAEVIMAKLFSSEGKLIGISKIVRDLTATKKAADELREAKVAAEAANKMKSTFVANMSHEIRTPLGAILGFAELLKDPSISEAEREECAQVIERNGKVLLRLIEDILDISKVEAGKLDIENAEIPVRKALAEVVALHEIRAVEKGITLILEVAGDTPDYIVSDPVRMRQIVSNIVGNAVKFTDQGGVHVASRALKQADGQIGLELFVADSGPGIPKDKRSRLFSEFSQADASITRRYGGSGLGLALSRSLARELGGEIELLDSSELPGSTFRIQIANQGKSALRTLSSKGEEILLRRESEGPQESYPHVKGSKVLLVEDSTDNQRLVQRFLTKAGASVEVASNGLEGITKASSGDYNAVLMDVQMPVMDGNSATAELRYKGYDRPIIALTAHAMVEDQMKSLNSGCDDYLSKPINVHELLSVLEKWIVKANH